MKELSIKQMNFVQHYVAGKNAAEAARAAGYAPKYAARAYDRLIHGNKKIAEAIDLARQKIRENTTYTAEKIVARIAEDIEFARGKGNAMAIIKGRELIAKISGLLVDRIQVERVDIAAPLAAARARALARQDAPIIDVPAEVPLMLPARRTGNPFD